MSQKERYSKTFTKHFKIKKCSACGLKFLIGDKLIRTRSKRHKLFHEDCYFTESREVKKEINPNTCLLRRTGIHGPIIFCKDQSCFKNCVKITKAEIAITRGEYPL